MVDRHRRAAQRGPHVAVSATSFRTGEACDAAKLSADQVRAIFAAKGTKTAKAVVHELGFLHISTVYAIWRGENWNEVTGLPRNPKPSRRKV